MLFCLLLLAHVAMYSYTVLISIDVAEITVSLGCGCSLQINCWFDTIVSWLTVFWKGGYAIFHEGTEFVYHTFCCRLGGKTSLPWKHMALEESIMFFQVLQVASFRGHQIVSVPSLKTSKNSGVFRMQMHFLKIKSLLSWGDKIQKAPI